MVSAEDVSGTDAYRKLEEADGLARKGQTVEASAIYQEAVRLYEKALQSAPDNRAFNQNYLYCLDKAAFVLIKQADSLRKEEKFSAAAPLYAQAVTKYDEAHEKLGKSPFSGNIEYARLHGSRSAFKAALAENAPAPELKLPAGDGTDKTYNLSDYRGKFVVLEFFVTWCPTCMKTAPKISQAKKNLGNENLAVIGVCLDEAGGFKRGGRGLVKFLQAASVEHPVALGNDETVEAYGISSVPTVIIIDQKGNLMRQLPYDADFDHQLESLIGPEKGPSGSLKVIRTKAARGIASAQWELGEIYLKAVDGPADLKEAAFWIRKAADQGHASSQMRLGLLYSDGKGVSEDDKEAVKWWRMAAEQGHPGAQLSLAIGYAIGDPDAGLQRDAVTAYAWMAIASNNGFPPAKRIKSEWKTKLNPEQIAKAQKLSQDMVKKNPDLSKRKPSGLDD